MDAQRDEERLQRLVEEARAAGEEARRLIEEARRNPLSPESIAKLHEARVLLLRATSRLDEATGAGPR